MIIQSINADGIAIPHTRTAEIPTETALARRIGEAYAVRATNEGQLFDPKDSSSCLTTRDKDRGGPKYTLKRCTHQCFVEYVQYLQTRNRAHLTIAQREFYDGQK